MNERDEPWDPPTEHDDQHETDSADLGGEDPPTTRPSAAQQRQIRGAAIAQRLAGAALTPSSTLPPPTADRRPAKGVGDEATPLASPALTAAAIAAGEAKAAASKRTDDQITPVATPAMTAAAIAIEEQVILLDMVSRNAPLVDTPRRSESASGGIVIVATGAESDRVRKLCHTYGLLIPVMASLSIVHDALSVVVIGEPSPPAPERVVHVVRPTISDKQLLELLRSLVSGRAIVEPGAATKPDQRVIDAATRLAKLDDRGAIEMIAIETITALVAADRAHCLFHDPASGALWSEALRRAGGDDRRAMGGLVGYAALTGHAIHASPAGDDPRWLLEIDDPDGKAQSRLLVQPIIGADRRVHAVLVAARRWRRPDFTDHDRKLLAQYATLAGPTLDLAVQAAPERPHRTTLAGTVASAGGSPASRQSALVSAPRHTNESRPPPVTARTASDSKLPPRAGTDSGTPVGVTPAGSPPSGSAASSDSSAARYAGSTPASARSADSITSALIAAATPASDTAHATGEVSPRTTARFAGLPLEPATDDSDLPPGSTARFAGLPLGSDDAPRSPAATPPSGIKSTDDGKRPTGRARPASDSKPPTVVERPPTDSNPPQRQSAASGAWGVDSHAPRLPDAPKPGADQRGQLSANERAKSDSADPKPRNKPPSSGPPARMKPDSKHPRIKPADGDEVRDVAVVASDADAARITKIAKKARLELVIVPTADDAPPYYRIVTLGESWSPDMNERVAYVARATITDEQLADLLLGLATDRAVATPPTVARAQSSAEARRAQIAFNGSRKLAAAANLAVAEQIAIATMRELLDADRAYCLYFDPEDSALWSETREQASGDDRRAIAGIAGWAARTGLAANTVRASADPRWLGPIDDPDGDANSQLLVQPIVTADLRIHGVLIAVRRAKRPGFAELDVSLLVRFAALVAPLLEQLEIQLETQLLLHDDTGVGKALAASQPKWQQLISSLPRWSYAVGGALLALLVMLAVRC